jgi:hypothetical protein
VAKDDYPLSNPEGEMLDFNLLKSLKETQFQIKKLNPCCDRAKAIKSCSGGMLTFNSCRTMCEDGKLIDNVTPLNAKIGFVSAAGPLFQEIKYGEGTRTDDVNVLNQALERVFVLRCSYAQLKRIVAIAIGPMYSSLIVFRRSMSDRTENLRILRIAKTTISDIWSCIT